MSPAARVAGMGLSPIRRMALDAPGGTVDLGLGAPGWPVPEVAWRALHGLGAAARGAPLAYGPNTSDPALVRAVARHASSSRAAASGSASTTDGFVGPEQVMVTAGSQAALFALFQAHVDPGTTVLVPDPGFVAYPTLARLCGATAVGYPLGPDGELDAEALLRVLGEQRHTSLVVLNHPANPTGGTASPTALRAVAQACRERGVLLLSDEVYAELWVGERPASVHDVVGVEGAVVLGSMSKAFAAPGLRVGWAVGAEAVLAPARLVHNAMTTAPARPSQTAALALLEAADEVLPAARDQLRARWQTVRDIAPHLLPPRVRPRDVPPVREESWSNSTVRAGIYLWPALPPGVDPDATEAFALRLRDEAGVITIPGSAFGPRGAGRLRVGIGGPLRQLEEGLRRLAPWWEA